jgi:signal transduction histidine kinase
MIKKYNQFVNENKQVPGPQTNGSVKLDINETEAELFSNEAELGELIADQKVSLLPPELWYMANDSDTIKVLQNYFDLTKVEEEEFNESVDSKGKEELEELSKRIKELQKEYEKKAKELGEKDEYKDLSMNNPYYSDDNDNL